MKPFNEHGLQEWDFKTGEHLHGDVIVKEIKTLPDNFEAMKKEPQDALAYGEFSGHLHKLFRMQDADLPDSVSFDLRIDGDGNKWLKVIEPIVVKHQEHSPRVIPAGCYKIGVQVEYDPFTKLARQVAD